MIENLLSNFNSPSSEYRGKPFWAWIGALNPSELCWQVQVFHKMGFVFFMHSRVGLATEYLSEEWFECIEAFGKKRGRAFAAKIAGDIVEKSKLIGFAFHKIASVLA